MQADFDGAAELAPPAVRASVLRDHRRFTDRRFAVQAAASASENRSHSENY